MKYIFSAILIVFTGAIFFGLYKRVQHALQPAKHKIDVVGWIGHWDGERASRYLPAAIDHLSLFSPMLYRIEPSGLLGKLDVTHKQQMLSFSRDKDVPVTAVIGDDFDFSRIHTLIYTPSVQHQFIQQLIAEANKENFIGWDIDIESLHKEDATQFTAFIRTVTKALHKNNLKLNVIVFARDEQETYDQALAHDYHALGEIADQIQIMVYGHSYEHTPPGSQTPLDWYRDVLEYARSTLPAEKIVIGLSTHNYDWGHMKVDPLLYEEVMQRLQTYHPYIVYNASASANVAYYTHNGINHELWYEDATTIKEKMMIACEEFSIRKFAIWRIGAEDPTLWGSLPVC